MSEDEKISLDKIKTWIVKGFIGVIFTIIAGLSVQSYFAKKDITEIVKDNKRKIETLEYYTGSMLEDHKQYNPFSTTTRGGQIKIK